MQPIDLPNVEFRIKDATEDHDELLASPLILLDTAHDGVFERKVYSLLVEGHYDGLFMLDDIYLNPVMQGFWDRIGLEKIDLTPLGHWSGTGLVRFTADRAA